MNQTKPRFCEPDRACTMAHCAEKMLRAVRLSTKRCGKRKGFGKPPKLAMRIIRLERKKLMISQLYLH